MTFWDFIVNHPLAAFLSLLLVSMTVDDWIRLSRRK